MDSRLTCKLADGTVVENEEEVSTDADYLHQTVTCTGGPAHCTFQIKWKLPGMHDLYALRTIFAILAMFAISRD
jgi:hypothetical protein